MAHNWRFRPHNELSRGCVRGVLRHLAVGIAGQVEVVIRLVLDLLDGLFAMGRDHLLDPEWRILEVPSHKGAYKTGRVCGSCFRRRRC